jgi:tetratricopeptide (TPR) repeat protein
VLLELSPDEPGLWSAYGFMLKTMGRPDDGLRAMRRATEVAPRSGEAWWNLSNVKTARFEEADIAAMRAALDDADLGDQDRFHLHFALGKACEDAGDVAAAFDHYDRGNAIRRRSANYQPNAVTKEVDANLKFFSREFFDARSGWGNPARDPIFIVGLPRSGSTLIEQILASHPLVEGTKELPDIPIIARELGRGRGGYYRNIAELDRDQTGDLGREYLDRARTQRPTDRPHFIDKMPTNWLHVGLIHLILPNAKIIDARRHPLACGFSNFKQLYVEGHTFSYDLKTIAQYYADYVRLMAHFDAVLPGRIHRVIHEQLVEDTEGEVRRMLDYLELPFDPACLRFYETDRPVRTPSAEQVRKPISREGVDQWQAFEAWLGPLKESLGPVLDAYPGVPDFLSD